MIGVGLVFNSSDAWGLTFYHNLWIDLARSDRITWERTQHSNFFFAIINQIFPLFICTKQNWCTINKRLVSVYWRWITHRFAYLHIFLVLFCTIRVYIEKVHSSGTLFVAMRLDAIDFFFATTTANHTALNHLIKPIFPLARVLVSVWCMFVRDMNLDRICYDYFLND